MDRLWEPIRVSPVDRIALVGRRVSVHFSGVRVRIMRDSVRIIQSLAIVCWLQATLRAASYVPGGKSSAATDVLFRGESVLKLSIEVDEAGLEILRANSSNRYNSPNRPNALATVHEGTNIYRRVDIHLKGSAGSFRGLDDKPAFTLNFSRNDPAQRFHGLEKISLDNSVQDSTFMCEFLGRQIFNATSVPVPRAGHATVAFNGQPLGLFVLVEGWNKQFLKRHFKDTKGNFYEGAFRDDITATLEVKSGAEPQNRSDLDALVLAARESDLHQRFTAMARVLDVNRFATFLALEVLLNHWDGYSLHVNNYRIFHDNSSGKLIFMPHGMDQLFGIRRRQFDPQLLPAMSGLAARAFMETPTGRRLYLERMAELNSNVFDVPASTAAVDKLEALLRPALRSDPGALAEFDARVPVLRERVADRFAEVQQQLAEMRTPLFDSNGETSLAGLNFRTSYPEPYFQRRGRFQQEFQGQSDGRTFGSRRVVVLLESGRYRLQARVRTQVGQRTVSSDAVALRSSAGRTLNREVAAKGWVVLEHEFTLEEQSYVDLTYEFGSMDGPSALDKSSLKLIHLPKTSGSRETK